MVPNARQERINDFVTELGEFAKRAESALERMADDVGAGQSLFSDFAEQMIAIRGTAQQLNFPAIARIAGLGEEIAIKGAGPLSPSQVRKAVSCLWDALTTVKYLLVHLDEETSEEREILVNRLEKTLQVLGGARATVSMDELDALLSAQRKR
ncbi:MAG: hypothetical protein NDJ90_03585 [Oligoflexia bacterium]|nr:hypothetical protein [Oligoflexia bacterium]